MNRIFKEKNLHRAFELSLLLKGVFALTEIVSGLLAYFVSQRFLLEIINTLIARELIEDPRDLVASYLLHAAQHMSISAQHFAAIYLLGHGVIKLWLIIGLFRKKLWYYPVAMIVFGLFIAYQSYRFSLTNSLWLLIFTMLDLVVMILTWYEFKFLRRTVSKEPLSRPTVIQARKVQK